MSNEHTSIQRGIVDGIIFEGMSHTQYYMVTTMSEIAPETSFHFQERVRFQQ